MGNKVMCGVLPQGSALYAQSLISISTPKTVEALMSLELPAGVEIEIKL